MSDIQDWGQAYLEITERIITKMPVVKLLDFWNDQPYFQEKEYPLPPVAVFLDFRSSEIKTLGNQAQEIPMTVEIILYHESPSDTHVGANTLVAGLSFIKELRTLHSSLHGFGGKHFSDLTRVAMGAKESVPGARIYSQTYETIIMDYGADTRTDVQDNTGQEVKITPESGIPEKETDNTFQIP